MSPTSNPPDHLPVVTGLGAVASIGIGIEAFWQAIRSGVNGARPITSFETEGLRNRVGCEIDEGRLEHACKPSWSGLPRVSRLAAVAATEALDQADLPASAIDALTVGTTTGEMLEAVRDNQAAPLIEGSFSQRLGSSLGFCGPTSTIVTSCSAGNIAISQASDWIRQGQAQRVLTGGADAISKFAFVGFSRMRAMAKERCSPFACGRQGMLLGEGAGFLMIESLASARERGATILAAVRGYGLSCDAFHIAAPAPAGYGAAAAMAEALSSTGLAPEAVGYVSAHGTGTLANDRAEAKACREVFGSHRPFVSSLKALVGHSLGAASALEAVASILSLCEQQLIPAWNVETQDPDCDVDLPLPESEGLQAPLECVISNAFAFGGNNSSLVLQRYG